MNIPRVNSGAHWYYRDGTVKLEDWLSAHVYLGLALIFVATLHAGFQFGWNVHTLAYTLMMLVILSGVFGLYAYVRYPLLMTENRRGATLGSMFSEIAELDHECIEVGAQLTDEIRDVVLYASEKTSIGGSVWRQLIGTDPEYATQNALNRAEEKAKKTSEIVFGFSLCKQCHLVTAPKKDGDIWRVARPLIVDRWMPKGVFVHASHKSINCIDCHEQAPKSKTSADVILPDLKSCRQCHGGEDVSDKLPSTCTMCHVFHRPELGPMRTDVKGWKLAGFRVDSGGSRSAERMGQRKGYSRGGCICGTVRPLMVGMVRRLFDRSGASFLKTVALAVAVCVTAVGAVHAESLSGHGLG